MKTPANDISHLIFQKNPDRISPWPPIEGQALSLFSALEGKSSVGEIALKTGQSMEQIRKSLTELLAAGLVVSVRPGSACAGADFFSLLRYSLAMELGPVAGVLIRETMEAMQIGSDGLPKYRAGELVKSLGRWIRKPGRRHLFERRMAVFIERHGYLSNRHEELWDDCVL